MAIAFDAEGERFTEPPLDDRFAEPPLAKRFRELYLKGLMKLLRKQELTFPAPLDWIHEEEDLKRWLTRSPTYLGTCIARARRRSARGQARH